MPTTIQSNQMVFIAADIEIEIMPVFNLIWISLSWFGEIGSIKPATDIAIESLVSQWIESVVTLAGSIGISTGFQCQNGEIKCHSGRWDTVPIYLFQLVGSQERENGLWFHQPENW